MAAVRATPLGTGNLTRFSACPIRTRCVPCVARPARQRRHVARVSEVSEATFEEHVLKSEVPVLIDFWATWCGPCKLMSPLMDWAEKEYNGGLKVVKIETDPNPELISTYKVYGLPTLLLFDKGKEIEGSKREGAVTKAILTSYLKQHGIIPKPQE